MSGTTLNVRKVFGDFSRCLAPVQKCDSDTERTFAGMLEHDAVTADKRINDCRQFCL